MNDKLSIYTHTHYYKGTLLPASIMLLFYSLYRLSHNAQAINDLITMVIRMYFAYELK